MHFTHIIMQFMQFMQTLALLCNLRILRNWLHYYANYEHTLYFLHSGQN